jgi:hypothetical protein
VSDLTERVARAMWRAAHPSGEYVMLADQQKADIRVEAREAIREVLAALREPSGAMQSAAMHRIGWLAIRDAMDVFARENGLDMPQEPHEGRSGACGPDERGILNAPDQTPASGLVCPPSGDGHGTLSRQTLPAARGAGFAVATLAEDSTA